jgi:hypothetical protein
MSRSFWFASAASAVLLAAFVVLALPLTASAQRQYNDEDVDIVWHCSKCGGMLGGGPRPPNFCPHCQTPLCSPTDFEDEDEPAIAEPKGKSTDASGGSDPLERIIVGAVVLAGLACLGYIVYGNPFSE